MRVAAVPLQGLQQLWEKTADFVVSPVSWHFPYFLVSPVSILVTFWTFGPTVLVQKSKKHALGAPNDLWSKTMTDRNYKLHTVCEILCSLLTKSSHLKIFTLTPSLASLTNIMHGTKSPFCWKKSPWVQWEEIILASSISPTLFRSHLVTSFTNLQWVNVSILSSPEDRWNGVLDFAQTYSRSKLGEDKQESLVQLQQAGSQRRLVQTFFSIHIVASRRSASKGVLQHIEPFETSCFTFLGDHRNLGI